METILKARKILMQAKHVAVFSGAGLSAESGLATFRDPETDALWAKYDPIELASRNGFHADPERVMDWYAWRRRKLAEAKPNPGHFALAKYPNLIQITQNVDNLLEQAGVANKHINHLHGEIIKDHCDALCGYSETIHLENAPLLRTCPSCQQAYMRPSVVWFGEALPDQTWQASEQLCRVIDCLLVIGTSATVYPAAGLIDIAQQNDAKVILLNTQESPVSGLADIEMIGPSGEILPQLLDELKISSYSRSFK